jgi:NADPH2:quinone reductase
LERDLQAMVTRPPGGWSATGLSEVPEPVPRAEEVLVQIHAAGINPADYFLIEGAYPGGPKPPFIAGRDAAGIVVTPDANGRWSPGDSVVVLQSTVTNLAEGTFCQRQKFRADVLAPVPKGWSMEEAAAAPLVYLTAWKALVACGKLQPGQVVLVTGASGGVGTAAVQLARALGAKVVALSRSPDKRKRLAHFGADHVFPTDSPDLKDLVFTSINKRGVDLVVETIGGPSLANSIHLLGSRGRVSVVGLLAGIDGTVPIPSLIFKRATIMGVLVGDDGPDQAGDIWQRIVTLLSTTKDRPTIDSVFALRELPKAVERLRASPFGKVVLKVAES